MDFAAALLLTTAAFVADTAVGAWVGRKCCEQAVTDQCRSGCIQANTRDGITSQCPAQQEANFYDCIFRQQTKHRCCYKPKGYSRSCRYRCDVAFRSKSGPFDDIIDEIEEECSHQMASCMRNFTRAQNETQSTYCCDKSPDPACATQCRAILRSETDASVIATRLVQACGDVRPHEPLWRCFFYVQSGEEQPRPQSSPPYVAKLQCCSRAVSDDCRQLCRQIYDKPWPNPQQYDQYERKCKYSNNEIDLNLCLQDVQEPCRMGCSGLSFCTNFNNRPTELFRSCNAENDEIARDLFNSWGGDYIYLPAAINIPVKPIHTCDMDKWKAVACSLQIKPCSSRSGESIICKSDCVDLLNRCVDKSRLPNGFNVDDLCDMFSPQHMQSDCINLSTYTKPREQQAPSEVSQPCHPNPCSRDEVCVMRGDVMTSSCQDTASCPPKFSCVPGCRMSRGSSVSVAQGSLVRVPRQPHEDGCYETALCSATGRLTHHRSQSRCFDEKKHCTVAGQIKLHGSMFEVDCNFCTCYAGQMTCTKRQCRSDTKLSTASRQFPGGAACDCPSLTRPPVCSSDGRVFPDPCGVNCLVFANVQVKSCDDRTDPCSPNPCRRRERCVATPRVCVTQRATCPQHECVPRHNRCVKLLRNTLLRHEGKSFTNPNHRYNAYQDVLSSSIFFSNSALLDDDRSVCDDRNQQHADICRLLRHKGRSFKHMGRCKAECATKNSKPQCGYDGTTYNNTCQAEANAVLIDHQGACVSSLTSPDTEASRCAGVDCASVDERCEQQVLPPGGCCPVCNAALIRVLVSQDHLDSVEGDLWRGAVTVRDLLWHLRRHLNVYECKLYGHVTIEDDLAVLIVSTASRPTPVQVEACTSEAERLTRLINTQSPTLNSHLLLSSLTAATVTSSHPHPSSSAVAVLTSSSALLLALALLLVFDIT